MIGFSKFLMLVAPIVSVIGAGYGADFLFKSLKGNPKSEVIVIHDIQGKYSNDLGDMIGF
ncbi:hypothetical protein MSU_0561 [Mycoplasma suis str. Illinois]|uniref:Uncharacterized protein n=2 Tax=Mycoplasma suis TaxID=57372 RepID=F0QRH4_MYCSL|nr:hypothetical protein MSU_0561 [Mycoplasma suis str. Illinois]